MKLQTIQQFCDFTNTSIEDIRSRSRKQELSDLRTMLSVILIGSDCLNTNKAMEVSHVINRDRTTILFYLKRHTQLIRFDKEYSGKYASILEQIK